jgi:G3E family GTPase
MTLGAEQALTVTDGDNQEWLELDNGCICCTVKDSLLLTLEQLLKRSRQKGVPFEHIIIEMSGLADPGPLLEIFWVDDALESDVYMDAVITVCDACHIQDHIQNTREAQVQLAFADRILLNKCDLVSPEKLQAAVGEIRSINSSAQLIECSFSAVSLDQVVGIHAFDSERALAISSSSIWPSAGKESRHTHDISTVNVSVPGLLDKSKLVDTLSSILWIDTDYGSVAPCDVLRMKGVLILRGKSVKYSLQCVRQTWAIEKTPLPIGFPPVSHFVIIGRNLRAIEWASVLSQCLV